MGWVLCERAVYEPAPWLCASPIHQDRTRNGRSPDERSLRSCNRLKSDVAEIVRPCQKKVPLS